jgi:histidine triad (HIT) family protein
MSSIFSKIVQGEIPSYKIAEDERHYAFLDINPLQKGHTLVIPKKEVDYIFDLEASELADLQVFAQRVAHAMRKVLPCERIGQTIVGLEVPHAHIHLIPINGVHDMEFSKGSIQLDKNEFELIAEKIASAFE